MTKTTSLEEKLTVEELQKFRQARAELEMFYLLTVEEGVKLLALLSGTSKSNASTGTQPSPTKQ